MHPVFLAALVSLTSPPVDFAREIQPILARNCFACHGPDPATRQAQLRLDLPGRAVVAGDIAASPLVRRVLADGARRMPPPASGHTLATPEKRTLLRWIGEGGRYTTHWAFRPLARPRGTIDTLVRARLSRVGLDLSPEADRATLIRRVSLDLIGLPPSPERVAAFVHDTRADAFGRLVDELLASPRFGEHWARLWLDLGRYADTKGYEKDQPRTIWRWRDWVIDAFNADMPFDQFTIEQLAGDLLPDPTDSQRLATALHRNTMTNDEGGTDDEEFRLAAVKDRVDTTIQVWMGLTMGCAKCHSHKYDPITQTDYYRFLALFNQTEDADRYDDAPLAPTPTADQSERLILLQARERALPDGPERQAVTGQRQALEKTIPQTPVLKELPADRRRDTRVHRRGNFLEPGDPVTPAVLPGFGAVPRTAHPTRLDAARWLVSPENPLTARVMANRLWARLFGTGIVETEEDFGTQGAAPSHPELLDLLADTFRREKSVKGLLRTLALSRTYRQSSRVTPERQTRDPRNRLLSRSPRFRLSAEVVRDQALAAAGLLSGKIGGPSVFPPQPPGVWKTTYSNLTWETSPGEDRWRRALYTFCRRTSPYPALTTFDAGSGEVCTIRRIRTNTPLQALVTLNDPAFVEAAGALARKIAAQGLPEGFLRVLARHATPAEQARLMTLFRQALAGFRRQPADAAALLNEARVPLAPADDPALLAAWTVVGNVLLNLDETLTRP